MKKRIISIMLVISMVLMYVPTTALAEGAGRAGETYTKKEGTRGANPDGSEDPEELVDGNPNTKWCVTNFLNAYIIFQTSDPVDVSGYSIITGNDNLENPGRNPKSWTLYGCNDYTGTGTGTWTPIHSVTKDTVLKDENNQTYNYVFEKTQTAYNYFKLEISAIKGGDVMQMSEFQLTDCEHDWDDVTTTPATCTTAGFTSKICSTCHEQYSYNYVSKLGHSFTGEGVDEKCTRCDKTKSELHLYNYLDSDGHEKRIDPAQELTSANNSWTDTTSNSGWYVAKDHVTINERVNVFGDVHLILADDCILNVKGGIKVTGSNALTIYSQSMGDNMGKLIVDNVAVDYAGIGGNNYGEKGGNVTINGGAVTVTSSNGAGIGGGHIGNEPATTDSGNGNYNTTGGAGGTVTINGGIVNASSVNGAGIGGGGASNSGYTGGDGGNVTINGGVVTAKSVVRHSR